MIERTSPEPDLTVFEVTGEVEAEQVLRAIVAFLTQAPTRLVLWDFTRGTLVGMTPAQFDGIVARGAPYLEVRRGGRTALVVSRDVDFGLGRVFQAYAESLPVPFDLMVLRDRAEALAWLRSPPPPHPDPRF